MNNEADRMSRWCQMEAKCPGEIIEEKEQPVYFYLLYLYKKGMKCEKEDEIIHLLFEPCHQVISFVFAPDHGPNI